MHFVFHLYAYLSVNSVVQITIVVLPTKQSVDDDPGVWYCFEGRGDVVQNYSLYIYIYIYIYIYTHTHIYIATPSLCTYIRSNG